MNLIPRKWLAIFGAAFGIAILGCLVFVAMGVRDYLRGGPLGDAQVSLPGKTREAVIDLLGSPKRKWESAADSTYPVSGWGTPPPMIFKEAWAYQNGDRMLYVYFDNLDKVSKTVLVGS